MLSNHRSKVWGILYLAILALFVGACSSSSNTDQTATVEALAESISLTATAGARGDISAEDSLKTAEAEATLESNQVAGTQAALAQLSDEELAATSTAVAPILDQLPAFGINPNQGRVAWIHPPASLETEGYMQTDFINQYMFTTVEDFALSADITWNTQYGSSGCGFILRSDGKEEESNQYLLILSRFGDGRAVFMTVANGELVDGKDMYAAGIDPRFSYPNDTTNTLTVVGQGTEFSIYTNGTLVGNVTVGNPPTPPPIPTPPPTPEDPALMDQYDKLLEKHEEEVEQAQANYRARVAAYQQYDTNFERGFVAMAVFSESGMTSCQFENAWLWIDE
jgi:hypothetical protein